MRTYMNGKPIINQLNNGVLSSTNAMPLKNTTSDNGESFAIDRALFEKAYQRPVNYALKQTTNSFFQRRAPGITHGFIVDGPKSANQKKWIGGNRDSSNATMNRRIKSTGGVLTTSGPQSFTSPNDNNPRIEALARARGGGACVPAKVSGRNMIQFNQPAPIDPNSYYRIVSAGLGAMSAVRDLVTAAGTAYGVAPGFYKYTSANLAGVSIANTIAGTFVRSYNVLTINRTTGATVATRYDVFGTAGQATVMANYLNDLSSNVIVVVATFDEPRNASPYNYLPANLITAMQRCGAFANFGSTTGTPPGFINFRGSYVLVGIPGINSADTLQNYIGNSNIAGDPNAFIDLRFSVINGNFTYISGI